MSRHPFLYTRLANPEQRHHQHRPRRGRRRHYEPTSRERPQDPGFGADGAEGFFVECGEDDLTIWRQRYVYASHRHWLHHRCGAKPHSIPAGMCSLIFVFPHHN